MALFVFTKAIFAGEPIKVFNHGNHTRDFTYVKRVIRASAQIAEPNPDWSSDTPRIFNIGNNAPVKLNEYIEAIEEALGKTASRELLPLQPGDVPDTFADASELVKAVGYKPATPVREGVARFITWYRDYYGV